MEIFAAGTRASTSITNTATVDYILGGVPGAASASVTIGVHELIDVNVSWQNAANVGVFSPSTSQILAFLVTNTGNGVENFILNTTTPNVSPQFNPANIRLWEDADGDGILNPANDTQIPSGGSILLDGGAAGNDRVFVFVVSDIPPGLNPSDIGRASLNATSMTASNNSVAGNTGAVVINGGDGGSVDALIGVSGGQSNAVGIYEVVQNFVNINKAVTVTDSRGGNSPYPGSIVTYTLNVGITGSSQVNNLVILDVIPANTTYNITTDSIRLDGVLQTNAADAPADFSQFIPSSNSISVDLSQGGTVSITPPANFVISFDVIIN